MTAATMAVPASVRILSRIRSVQAQLDKARSVGDDAKVECNSKVRQAYVADLIDVLNEEEQAKPRSERRSFNLASTEAWIIENTSS